VADPVVGHTLGHYRIESKLGEGGMGVVWKARDLDLERVVALKVLMAEKLEDPDRRRRFVQEAKAASALNHPNIITIYDIKRTGSEEHASDFIAMEFVNGTALDQLIPRKGLRLKEALKYGIQIADALAAAHSAGIVHRDLKPGNVMVNENGLIKVLDFGLAKLTEHRASSEFAPTETLAEAPKTDQGLIVGTVCYMSPEQAEGKNLDARSDIFSFGSLLYEMLTGKRAFRGDSNMSTLAAILNREPEPIDQIAPEIPPEVSRIVQRCLRKDPSRRTQSMADVKLALEDIREESASGAEAALATRPAEHWKKRASAAILLIAAGGAGIWFLRDKLAPPASLQTVLLTAYPGYELSPSISPDGKQVAFSWDGEKQDNFDIYVKLIGSGRPLRLTSDTAQDWAPSWSPDGGSLAFLRRDGSKVKVMRIPALGGTEREIAEVFAPDVTIAFSNVSTAWTPDGRWVLASASVSTGTAAALNLFSVDSDEKRQLTRPPTNDFGDGYPSFSPDGRTLAFLRYSAQFTADVYVLPITPDLRANGEPRRLTSDNVTIYGLAWTADGAAIVFSSERGGTRGLWQVDISGSASRRLSVGQNGVVPAISARGNRLVYSEAINDDNIWRVNLRDRSEPPVQLLASTRVDYNPSYSPDGSRIAFESGRSGNGEVWVSDADGTNPVQLVDMGRSGSPRWSPDGRRIAFDSSLGGSWQIYSVNARGGRPERMTNSAASDVRPSWSRDGKWIYFGSNRSGVWQVWKMPARGGPAEQVTRDGGHTAFESPDGKTIYYTKNDSNPCALWKVPVEGGEESQILPAITCLAFAVSPQGIYFVSSPKLQYLDFSTGRSRAILTTQKQPEFGLSVSPDEHWLLYTQLDHGGSDLMLVENFH
jgi:Tol biopolymer transport system component/tRNA A-37 threonylcarbamoyl transferase component Bud32